MRFSVKKLFIILLLMIASSVLKATEVNPDSSKSNIVISMPEEITIRDISKAKTNSFEKYLPWIVALSIGVLSALVNILIAKYLMRSNERNMQSQLESNKENVLRQFKATLGTKNRQNWIDEVRHSLSEYLSKNTTFALYMKGNSIEAMKYFEQLQYNLYKLRLLLNEEDKLQSKLLACIDDFHSALHIKESELYGKEPEQRDKLIQCASQLFKVHWEKIKRLE